MKIQTLVLLITAATAIEVAAADLQAPVRELPDIERAELLAARHDFPAAVAAYRSAIAANPADATLHNRLGICFQRMGDAKAAVEAYRKAISLQKDYAAAHNNLGTIEHARGRYKQAIAAYATAIRLAPKDAVFHKNLGSAWLARGRVDKALEAWGEALRLSPESLDNAAVGVPSSGGVSLARQYFLYAKLMAAQGQPDRALEYLAKAHEAGFDEFGKVERDSDFATIVKDPRYVAMK